MFRWQIYRIMEMLQRQFNCGNRVKLAKRLGRCNSNITIEELVYMRNFMYILKLWGAD